MPLTKFKTFEKFACSDLSFDKMLYNEHFNKDSKGYILNFLYCPILNNVYRFTNIHSMLVNAIVEFNKNLILNQYKLFIKRFLAIFNKLNFIQQNFLFEYFYREKDWNSKEMIKFIKEKGESI